MSRFIKKKHLVIVAGLASTAAASYFYILRNGPLEKKDKNLIEVSNNNSGLANLPTRSQILAQLVNSDKLNPFDILVVGGGATGCGVALDAASRGLKVALVESDDFASGTSSRSTKLVHGGVRYLEKAVRDLDTDQFWLVVEALRERSIFLQNAPHLSNTLPIMLPLYKWWQVPYYMAGCLAYDLLAGKQRLMRSYYMSPERSLEVFPLLKRKGLLGALVYYDGQHNDARTNVALALGAITLGAAVANHVEVVDLIQNNESKISGARCRDTISKKEFDVYAKVVVNATGPYCDKLRSLDSPTCAPLIAPSAGVHIVLPSHLAPTQMGLLDPQASDGRVLFMLPWEGRTLVGTTDAPAPLVPLPRAPASDVAWLLEEMREYLDPIAQISNDDVHAAWAGIRPLIRDTMKNADSAALVRSHLIHNAESGSGLLTITGGKWTTYRAMAEEVVDTIVKNYNMKSAKPCSTMNLGLHGSIGYDSSLHLHLARYAKLSPNVAKHLARSYGGHAWSVAAMARGDSSEKAHKSIPNRRRGRLLAAGFPYIEAEILHAVRHEYACTAVDVLARRTRLAFLDAQAAADCLPRVIVLMASELDWDARRCLDEHASALDFLGTMGLKASAKNNHLARRDFNDLYDAFDRLATDSNDGQRRLVDISAMEKHIVTASTTSSVCFSKELHPRLSECKARMGFTGGKVDFSSILDLATCVGGAEGDLPNEEIVTVKKFAVTLERSGGGF